LTEDLWAYEFFTFGPDDKNNISIDAWLQSIIVCMHGVKVDRYLKQIKRVTKVMPEDSTVTFEQFIAF
jgi:hypothetical protein